MLRLIPQDKELMDNILESGNVPKHVAIIMDGNGRWARAKGLSRAAGHRRGVETVRNIVKACSVLNIKYLTLYTFSTENWKRPKNEISTLMRLIVKSLHNETNELHLNNVKFTMIGDIKHLPVIVQKELMQAVEKTKDNTKLTLNLAISYSGRWEIIRAIKDIAENYKEGKLQLEEINEELVSEFLSTRKMPDPDLLIRSGGEFRISNFLIWQIAYSEIYVTNVLWPEFKVHDLLLAISDYQSRERRFGLISEQVSKNHKNNRNIKKHTKHLAET